MLFPEAVTRNVIKRAFDDRAINSFSMATTQSVKLCGDEKCKTTTDHDQGPTTHPIWRQHGTAARMQPSHTKTAECDGSRSGADIEVFKIGMATCRRLQMPENLEVDFIEFFSHERSAIA